MARAFVFEDLDWLSKPMPIPTDEQLQAQRAAFERDNLVLDVRVVDGCGLRAVMLDHGCDSLALTSPRGWRCWPTAIRSTRWPSL